MEYFDSTYLEIGSLGVGGGMLLSGVCWIIGLKVRNAKFAVGALTASAAAPLVAVVASASGEEPATTTATGLAKYSDQITNTFSGMVDDIMPIAIAVLGTGATIFGLFIAWKLARKALGTVAK